MRCYNIYLTWRGGVLFISATYEHDVTLVSLVAYIAQTLKATQPKRWGIFTGVRYVGYQKGKIGGQKVREQLCGGCGTLLVCKRTVDNVNRRRVSYMLTSEVSPQPKCRTCHGTTF